MWLGLLYLPSDDGDKVILCAWERGRGRPFTVAGPVDAVAEMARWVRDAANRAGAAPRPPRCDGCLQPFDLPLL